MFYEIACRGGLKSNVVHNPLKEKIGADPIVLTGKHRAYLCALKELNVACHNACDSKTYHAPLDPIKALHSRLKTFLVVFHGASASGLDNYLVWFNCTETFKRTNGTQITCILIIKQLFQEDYQTTWRSYKAITRSFMDYWESK